MVRRDQKHLERLPFGKSLFPVRRSPHKGVVAGSLPARRTMEKTIKIVKMPERFKHAHLNYSCIWHSRIQMIEVLVLGPGGLAGYAAVSHVMARPASDIIQTQAFNFDPLNDTSLEIVYTGDGAVLSFAGQYGPWDIPVTQEDLVELSYWLHLYDQRFKLFRRVWDENFTNEGSRDV